MLARRTKCLRGPRSVCNASGLPALCNRLHCCPRLVKREQAPRTPNASAQSVSPAANESLLRFVSVARFRQVISILCLVLLLTGLMSDTVQAFQPEVLFSFPLSP